MLLQLQFIVNEMFNKLRHKFENCYLVIISIIITKNKNNNKNMTKESLTNVSLRSVY